MRPGTPTIGDDTLPEIPVVDADAASFPRQTLVADMARAHALLSGATHGVPRFVLTGLDNISRRWLVRQANPHLQEIDELSTRMGRPGGHFLSVSYEWGCSVAVGPTPDGQGAQLVRTLDWFTPGLGRHVMAARVASDVGRFVTMTWPGFTGALQAMAPGRFSVALNQAPLRRLGGGIFAADWLANKVRVWRTLHTPPLHLLRRVLAGARDYAEARAMLTATPIATPATFSIAGVAPHDCCVIERTETEAHVIPGPTSVTNHWRGLDHGAHPRGIESEARLEALSGIGPVDLDPSFPWLREPVLNELTRLAMVAEARTGELVAQGYEDGRPATRPLLLTLPPVTMSQVTRPADVGSD